MNLPGTPLTEISLGREGLAYVDYCLRGETGLMVIAELARTTVHVFAGAYDQEGFVVWSK
jgi:hypothetical protein